MEPLALPASNYNYYPNTAVNLCAISYDDMGAIAGEVAQQTNLQVVWGPVELNSWWDISYSRMFIAANKTTGEYFVVIRGTNPESLSSWLQQDFAVSTSKPFNQLAGNPPVPAAVVISAGAFRGAGFLLQMTDHKSKLSALDFLKKEKPRFIYVTGHSLGGTLTPVMFTYLNAILYGGRHVPNMTLWSFAGLTAGGTTFNNYLNSLIGSGVQWRFQNSLDIAPLMFASQTAVQNIYSYYGLEWSYAEEGAFDYLFGEAAKAGIGYAQPQTGVLMKGYFSINEQHSWAGQAMVQHHASPTYQQLVQDNFPLV